MLKSRLQKLDGLTHLHPLRFKTAPFGEIINQQGLPISRRVNFGFGSSSKLPDKFLLLDK